MKPFLRPALESDFDFAFEAKRDAMGPYITARWGWDQDYQRSIHTVRWTEKPWFIVMLEHAAIRTVAQGPKNAGCYRLKPYQTNLKMLAVFFAELGFSGSSTL